MNATLEKAGHLVPTTSPQLFRKGVSPAEYAERLAKVRTAMSEQSLSALIVEDVPSSVELRWRSGEHQAALTW